MSDDVIGARSSRRQPPLVAVQVLFLLLIVFVLSIVAMILAARRYDGIRAHMTRSQVRSVLRAFRETRLNGTCGGNINATQLSEYPRVSLYKYDAYGLPTRYATVFWGTIYVAYDSRGRVICADDDD